MTRVAMLAHVKESTIVEPPSLNRVGARIPWTGGKIVSNKDEALRKFYERKLRNGATTLTADQKRALEESIAKLGDIDVSSSSTQGSTTAKRHKNKHDVVHKIKPITKRMAHRAHVKVSSHQQKTIVVNGRVVGPRVDKTNATRNTNLTFKKNVKSSSKTPEPTLALQDQLSMSLDALVKRRK